MRLFYLCAAAGLLACATSGSSTKPGANTSIITRAEIEASNIPNAWDLVRRERPAWFRSRGSTTGVVYSGARVPNVYRNNDLQGNTDVLRNMSTADILEIRFYSAAQVPPQYGAMNPAGVIVVTTR